MEKLNSKVTLNSEKVVTEIIENGILKGISKARNIDPNSSDEFLKDHIVIEIMKQLNNYIKWN